MRTKIFAAYLPQYHEIEENNMFWGKGFTDWVGVKKATPQFEKHAQPKIPQNGYYDLSNWEVIKEQAVLAKEYGIDGFNIYHYWFKDGHKVLQTPAENLLAHPEIDISYMFSWDNNSWVRSWSNISGNAWSPVEDSGRSKDDSKYLLECDYGGETDWIVHFNYLLPFFLDSRYYKIDGKPVFAFFSDRNPKIVHNMGVLWDKLAKEAGFKGMFLLIQKAPFIDKKVFDNQFIYQPLGLWNKKRAIKSRLSKYLHLVEKDKVNIYDYDLSWKKIIKQAKKERRKSVYYSGLVRYDDTPRRGEKANVFVGDTPEKFERYFRKLFSICNEARKEFVLLTAWNEWGEGAYLEPDTKTKTEYLEAIRNVVNEY